MINTLLIWLFSFAIDWSVFYGAGLGWRISIGAAYAMTVIVVNLYTIRERIK